MAFKTTDRAQCAKGGNGDQTCKCGSKITRKGLAGCTMGHTATTEGAE